MRVRTRITQMARQRGLTAAEVGRRLGLYPSNLSAMDAGTRAVSVSALARIAQFLDCGLGDLIEIVRSPDPAVVYRRRALTQRLLERDEESPDGVDKGWVHRTMLAWQRHAGFRRSRG